jgi:uncharacterized membrane protein YeiH
MMLLTVIEILGIFVAALSGILEAKRNSMDLIGIYTVAFITALGGGTIRDILLNRYPIFWVIHPEYAGGIFILSVITALILRYKQILIRPYAIIIPDALALGLYSAIGAAYAMELHVSWFIAMLMGTITATFGGVMRDILCNKVPDIFKHGGPLYATCAFGAAVVYVLVKLATNDHASAATASVIVATALRLASVKFDITLPI